MAYIYKIINDINDKIYIGQTSFSLNKRFQEHISEVKKNFKNRPLYSAMKKYGIEHFHIELIEETENPEEREIYWINYYNSYHNGYNATLGGEGRRFISFNRIYLLWLENNKCSMRDLARMTNHDEAYLKILFRENNIETKSGTEVIREKFGKKVLQLDKETEEIIREFETVSDAEVFFGKKRGSSHIGQVCNGKRKTALGYKWKWK